MGSRPRPTGEPEIPVRPGDVIRLEPGDYMWDDTPLRLYVDRVRGDLARYYDNELVWIEGHTADPRGVSYRRDVLVRVSALLRAAPSRP
jgi:hypothetical protein